MVLVVGVMLRAFAGGVALAKVITCSGGPCVGTDKADMITGSPKKNTINAKKGSDNIDASQGGRDTVKGGGGADQIIVRDATAGSRDTVECGGGQDTVFADPDDKIASDCELEG